MPIDDDHPLYLHEEALLIALRDDRGTIEPGTWYQYAMGASILAEIFLHDRATLEGDDPRKATVRVVDATPIGEPILDDALELLVESKKDRTATHWVSKFGGFREIAHRVAERLCAMEILHLEKERVLIWFTRRVYPEQDAEPERVLREEIREAILGDRTDLDPRTAVLIAILNQCSLLKVVLSKDELDASKERLEQIAQGHFIGEATRIAIESMQSAMMTAVIVSTF